MNIEKRYINQDYTDDPITCDYRKGGLICPKIAAVSLYGEEMSGHFCTFHADELLEIEKEKENDELD